MKKTRILFVCHGNICRSPMAEIILRDMVKRRGLEAIWSVASAATSTEELGSPVYCRAREKLSQVGLSAKGKTARQMTRGDYAQYDWLLGMDGANIRNMTRIAGGDPEGKIMRLLDLTDRPRDIADPWYSGNFDQTYVDIVEGCEALLKKG